MMGKIIVLIFVAATIFLSWCGRKISDDCDNDFTDNLYDDNKEE